MVDSTSSNNNEIQDNIVKESFNMCERWPPQTKSKKLIGKI